MERFRRLLLEVWREACRHTAIQESAGSIAPILNGRLPLRLLLIRQLRRGERCICTAATALDNELAGRLSGRTGCDLDELERILRWAHAGEPLAGGTGELLDRLPGLLPPELEGEVLVGPLLDDGEPVGLLVLVAAADRAFSPAHLEMMRALLEPFAAAVANDRQFRELRALREALEADKRSLLSRLGRQDISDSVVGDETGLRQVMQRVSLVAPSDAPVLILGETGSGKEVVARALHQRSARSTGPFLRVNCGAIPSELIDSELFGHERGSFTGAVASRQGWFERADGGTLLLDEVAELQPAAQVRLLRVLQDGAFERVGGERPLHVNVRVVAATNRNLRQMVAEGTFREDLWYRLAVFPVHIPPLRERRDDIPQLAAHFALRAAKRLGLPPHIPSQADCELLLRYAWPGNVRELAAVIERAAILGNGRRLDLAGALGLAGGLEVEVSVTPEQHPATGPTSVERMQPERPPTQSLDEAMKGHIRKVLEKTRGRVEGPFGAARLLQINANTLRSRMRKLGLKPSDFRDEPPRLG
ncbi:MAG: sigma 54-interacting transcriptional regulator [Phycisphaerales bacterium JB038]